jgi:hypothetical protein
VSKFQNFVPGLVGPFDLNLTNAYYDPFNFNSLNSAQSNILTGTVLNQSSEPVKDAVVIGFNWKYTQDNGTEFDTSDDLPQGNWIYTFTKPDGSYRLVPYNDVNIGSNDNRIISLSCSGIGYSINYFIYQEHTDSALFGIQNLPLNKELLASSNVNGELVNLGQTQNFNGGNQLTMQNVIISHFAHSEITAENEVNVNSYFDADFNSEVHIYLKTIETDCFVFSDLRSSDPNSTSIKKYNHSGVNEIEIQFEKSGHQILEAEIQPNPSDGIVNLLIKEKSSILPVKISVYNLLGQCIKTYESNESIIILDGIQWYKGIYIVTIKSENTSTVKKVIIN